MQNSAKAPSHDGDPREVAVSVVTAVLGQGRSLTASLEAHIGRLNDRRDRAFAQELSYGIVRWLPRLQTCLDRLMEKPLREKEILVRAVLLLGLYQLMYTRVAEHAAVAESVDLVRRAGKHWAAGLVNGVLRNFQRRRVQLSADLLLDDQATYAHTAWLMNATRQAWPQNWQQILESNNERPPLSLRVNAHLSSREKYLAELTAVHIAASPIAHTGHGIHLHGARDVEAIPGFDQGLVSVQDGAAQLSAGLLDVRPGMRVLDACAAPGGKSAHILEQQPQVEELVAMDRDTDRLQRVERNLRRLSLQATLVCADAGDPDRWWNGVLFQRILLDAPCTATGVIRRHPDIKLHRRPDDVEKLAASQARLLGALWPLLAPQGLLLYATCSYLPRENDHVLAEFLAKHPDASGGSMPYAWGHSTAHGRQVLPGEDTMDGFYYAMLGKR
ncbi:MAG: 16S rRNA (cytosine(967)-C(5))-methyltransferase RsmB [Lysobacterales bacterium]|nr:MAG: 16S rRNA (cytosine(967)-C(5))-methyltransferase RsmB [Xanthomonadales bacterium]